MKIEYIFVNGEKSTVEVSGEFEEIILELDRNLYNNNHAETRRHISLDAFDQNKNIFADIEAGPEERISKQVDKEILYKAISKLKPEEQELIHSLYLDHKPITQKEYAKNKNLSIESVKMRVQRAKAKIKELLYKNNN